MLLRLLKKIKGCFCFSIGFLFAFNFATAMAFQDPLGTTWQVNSAYYNPFNQKEKKVTWQFSASPDDNGFIVFINDAGDQIKTNATLVFNGDLKLKQADVIDYVRDKKIHQTYLFSPDKPAIIEDAYLPVNWLQAENLLARGKKMFRLKKKIGKVASFVSEYKIASRIITTEDALQRGYINEKMANFLQNQDLKLIEAISQNKRNNDQRQFMQLWSQDLSFWVYEKVPYRRSWLNFP